MSASSYEESLGPKKTVELSAGEVEYHERGEGRPIVFVHGLVLHAGFWRKVAPAFAESHRCIVPTLPLGGHSLPVKPEADLSPTGIADLLAELLEKLDLDDAVVVGNDTGGAFAQILVTRKPERVGALVLTPCDAFEHFLPRQFRHLQVLSYLPGSTWQTGQLLRSPAFRRSPLGFGLLTKHGLDDEVSAGYTESLRRNRGVRRDLTKVLRGIRTRYTHEAAKSLPGFGKPALIAWAAEEKVFPLADARKLAELLPDSRLEVIPDSRTYVPEDNPDELVRLMRSFLERPLSA